MSLPEGDRHIYTRQFVRTSLMVLLGGRVAEDVACGDISSGAADDIKRASQLARTMICEWGMSDRVGPIRFASDPTGHWPPELAGKEYSEQTARAIDEEIQQLIRGVYDDVKKLLSEHRDKLDKLAEALLKYETLEADDVKRVIRGEPIVKPTVSDLLEDVAGDRKAVVPVGQPSRGGAPA